MILPFSIIPARKEPVTHVGPFTAMHNFMPSPFNPEYDPRAKGWSTLATYDAALAGAYNLPREEAKKIRDTFYEIRKAKGDYTKAELQRAEQYIYEM